MMAGSKLEWQQSTKELRIRGEESLGVSNAQGQHALYIEVEVKIRNEQTLRMGAPCKV